VKRTFSAPRLLLGTRTLTGVTLATRDRTLEMMARYREPESLAVTLSKALDAGVDGVFASPSPALSAALAVLRRTVPLYLVLPALTEQERLELTPGVEDPLERGRRQAGAGARLRLSVGSVFRPAFLFRGNLRLRLPLLLDLEIARARLRKNVRGVVLDAWLTDLALAAGNRRFFQSYCRFVRRRFRAAAGFETYNLGVFLARLREWDLQPDFVVGPLNPYGLMMKPSAPVVMDELAQTRVAVVARELRAGGVGSLADGARFAWRSRVHGLAPDLFEMEDVGAELRALKREGATAA
jgi:hypothetical protein